MVDVTISESWPSLLFLATRDLYACARFSSPLGQKNNLKSNKAQKFQVSVIENKRYNFRFY